jgi:uncharacterized protein (TIGR00369 family)
MNVTDEIQQLLDNQPKPVCAALTPFELVTADDEPGSVKIAFAPQPAFENHFGNIQGGFAVAMLDVVISIAAYVAVRQWLPTVEVKTSFVAPARIGRCVGEGTVLRAGKSFVFVEAKLWNDSGDLAVHATATLAGIRN